MAQKCTRVSISKVPEKFPNPQEHFKITKDVELPALGDEDVLIQVQYISADPYLRGLFATFVDPKPIVSNSIGIVTEVGTKCKVLKKGDSVFGGMPWQTFYVAKESSVYPLFEKVPYYQYVPESSNKDDNKANTDDNKQPDLVDLSKIKKSYFVGQFGMPGMTAWYGLFDEAKCKPTDTVLVSGGAGAVGTMVGQFAKCIGCTKIIGTAGSQEKLDYMKSLGFTDVINYKEFKTAQEMQAKLKEILGKDGGIDIYYDNTGGHVTESVWDLLKYRGRVIICGQIAEYNVGNDVVKVPSFLKKLIGNEVKIQGIQFPHFKNHMHFYGQVGRWIEEDKIKFKETVMNGLDKAPEAMCGLFKGTNMGKMIISLAD